MPFWRKSEDPWDMEPEKRRTWTAGEPQPPAADRKAPAPPPEEGQPAEPGLWGEIKDLGKVLTESWSPGRRRRIPSRP